MKWKLFSAPERVTPDLHSKALPVVRLPTMLPQNKPQPLVGRGGQRERERGIPNVGVTKWGGGALRRGAVEG